VIPRWQRILFGILLGASTLMGIYLYHLHRERRRQLAALSDSAPIAAPYTADAEPVTLAIANDADGSITPTVEQIALPTEEGARARALLERLLSDYALPKSTHPLTGGPSVDDVFLLPADAPKPVTAATAVSDYTSEPSDNTNQLAVINLHGAFVQNHPSGILPEMLTIQSILSTLHATLPQITQVRFVVDGQQVPTLAGHADLTRIYPVTDTATGPINADATELDPDNP
jgi:hypothetical protein